MTKASPTAPGQGRYAPSRRPPRRPRVHANGGLPHRAQCRIGRAEIAASSLLSSTPPDHTAVPDEGLNGPPGHRRDAGRHHVDVPCNDRPGVGQSATSPKPARSTSSPGKSERDRRSAGQGTGRRESEAVSPRRAGAGSQLDGRDRQDRRRDQLLRLVTSPLRPESLRRVECVARRGHILRTRLRRPSCGTTRGARASVALDAAVERLQGVLGQKSGRAPVLRLGAT